MHVLAQIPTALVLTPHNLKLSLPVSMLLIFGSAKLLVEIFERLHQPVIVGEVSSSSQRRVGDNGL